jgi:hypothetical protein
MASMNVPNIGQSLGSVAVLSRSRAADDVVVALRGPGSVASKETEHKRTVSSDEAFARIGWFDANGDGQIDARSAVAGGDATLLLPRHAVSVPTHSRQAPRANVVDESEEPVVVDKDEKASAPAADTDGVATPAARAVQTRVAIDAYQRYGGQPTNPVPSDRAVA